MKRYGLFPYEDEVTKRTWTGEIRTFIEHPRWQDEEGYIYPKRFLFQSPFYNDAIFHMEGLAVIGMTLVLATLLWVW